ncbi:hypothetical protein [Tateyamaria sp. ANG-S1]|uniref:hypothetical protein n=1 Tax=Tateyamaria sp. ANG-S1 TaxID=1577905 RepID=UPI00057E2A6C|nr:hypothetical protein [Tateyamaria sp. ANG-S1]KIC51120.1 hypothetical protein RA29_04450 [Tateyamaria sp. ANG-S1]
MPITPRPAIFCFSKTGHSRRVADAFACRTGADIVQIEVERYRFPLLWIARAIWDVGRKAAPPLLTGNIVPAQRPWIVAAGPVWANEPAPPLRSVLAGLATLEAPVGVLLTCGRSKEQSNSFATCETVLGRPLAACVSIPNDIEDTEDMDVLLSAFASAMTGRSSLGAA